MGIRRERQSGFTIIEVMIVLVIAAVILMVIFFAVPALQRNQRNARRSRDAAQLATLVRECVNNNISNVSICSTVEGIHLEPLKTFSIFTGAHYGSTTFPGSGGTSLGPTIEEPNWLFGLKCTPDLKGFTSQGADPYRSVVVTYAYEPINANGFYPTRCIDV